MYLRAYEGRSGATDSLLAAIPSQSGCASSQLQSVQETRVLHAQVSQSSSPSPSLPLTPPNRSPAPSRKPGNSFAEYAAHASPVMSPTASALPPSPALSHLVAAAINSAGQLNASPYHASRSGRGASAPERKPTSPLPLPRRPSDHSSKSPGKALPILLHKHRTSLESSTSSQDVETQLTEDVDHSQFPYQPKSQPTPCPTDLYPALRTQAPYQSPSLMSVFADKDNTFRKPTDRCASGPSFRSGILHISSQRDSLASDSMDFSPPAAEIDQDADGITDDEVDVTMDDSQTRPPNTEFIHSEGSQTYGYGFTSSLPLQTQAPYYTQSQSQ
ncbi:hypothetical protein AcV5_002187 [Taiwanofungus camphoratus]|nr:hypothetical protein AcV5_002187 [Antrodia cinnamomea]